MEAIKDKIIRDDRIGLEIAMTYVLADMLEQQMCEFEDIARRECITMKQQLRHALNQMKHGAKEFHYWMMKEQLTQQDMIGICSDVFLCFLHLLVDHSKEDVDMFRIYNMVKAGTKSHRGLDLNKMERSAFKEILENAQE